MKVSHSKLPPIDGHWSIASFFSGRSSLYDNILLGLVTIYIVMVEVHAFSLSRDLRRPRD